MGNALVRNRWLELAAAVALGYALSRLAESIATDATLVLAQLVSSDEGVLGLANLFSGGLYLLNVELWSIAVFYGRVLASLIALGLLASMAVLVVRRRDRELGVCPFCASRIPHESRHCAYCGSGVEPTGN